MPTTCPIVSAHGAQIPALGLGTWLLKDDVCETAIATALDAGYRHIDTAAMYGMIRTGRNHTIRGGVMRVREKGQVTIPLEVRRRLGIETGTQALINDD